MRAPFSFVRFGAQKNKRKRDVLWSLSDKRRARVHLRVAGAAQGLGPRTESWLFSRVTAMRSVDTQPIYMIEKLNKWKLEHWEKFRYHKLLKMLLFTRYAKKALYNCTRTFYLQKNHKSLPERNFLASKEKEFTNIDILVFDKFFLDKKYDTFTYENI